VSESVNRPEAENAFDERIIALVRWKARSLVGRTGLTRQDCPDLTQELLACLVVPLRGYEAGRASQLTYACTLVNRFAANILRARRAAKRAGGPVESLSDDLSGADTTIMIDASTEVGRALNRVFVGLVTREFGAGSFRVERVQQTKTETQSEPVTA
jgi:DNA-directed RNA polymerase specialized sigma24 family protein